MSKSETPAFSQRMGRLRSIASDSVERVSLLPVPACPQHWVRRCGRRWTFLFLCPQHRSAGMGPPETWRSLGCSHGDGHIHRYVCLSACLSSHPASEQLGHPTLGRGVGPTVRNSIKGQDPAFWSEFCALCPGAQPRWKAPAAGRRWGFYCFLLLLSTEALSWCCLVPERTVFRTDLSRWTPGCQAISWAFGPALHPLYTEPGQPHWEASKAESASRDSTFSSPAEGALAWFTILLSLSGVSAQRH